jgi:hypothetical protein
MEECHKKHPIAIPSKSRLKERLAKGKEKQAQLFLTEMPPLGVNRR